MASSVRPGTIPSANPTVDNRNPKEACGNGSNYGYGVGSAGPLKTAPGKNNIVKDVILSTIEITAGVVATAVVGTVLGVGASKLLRALKPVGRGIVQGALSAGRNLFNGVFGKKPSNSGGADKLLLDYNLQFFGGDDDIPNGVGMNSVTSNKGNVYDNTPSSNHSIISGNPIKGQPNSSVDILDKNGNIARRRWFGPDGNQMRDLDYTNHGNSKTHTEWPHEHGPRIP